MVNPGSLTYRPRATAVSQGIVGTVAFVVLLLGAAGPAGMQLSAIYRALSAFRGVPLNRNGQVGCCNHLFNRVYGYVSVAHNPAVPWGFFYRFGTTQRSLWYRTSRGVYALNANGVQLYASLLAAQ